MRILRQERLNFIFAPQSSTDGKLASASQGGTVRIWAKAPSTVMLVP
jgi:hypothetical protein